MGEAETLAPKERHLLVLRQAYLQSFTAEERSAAGHFFSEALRKMRESGVETPSPQSLLDEALKVARSELEDPSASQAIRLGARRFLEVVEEDPVIGLAGAYWSLAWNTLSRKEKDRLRSLGKDLRPSREEIQKAMMALDRGEDLAPPSPLSLPPRPLSGITPTPEQEAALEAFLSGEDMKLLAVAGSGKTTTLRLMAEAAPKRRILYVAFNRSVKEEAERRFPKNTEALTLHGLARRYAVEGSEAYQRKLNAGQGRVSPKDILEALELPREQYAVAYAVRDTLSAFLRSASQVPTPAHIPRDYREALKRRERLPKEEYILKAVKLLWKLMQNPEDPFPLSFDGYVKIWAEAGGRISGYDAVLVDEAQDLSPVFLQVLEGHQRVLQRVYVGDPRQQIYRWRGAVNAMDKLEAPERPLTWSFRFSEELALGVRRLMARFGSPLELRGKAPWETQIDPSYAQEPPFTVLCRTNVGAVEAVATFLLGNGEDGAPYLPQAKVHLVGGPKDLVWLLQDAAVLKEKREREKPHPELALVETWEEVEELAQELNHPSARMLLRLSKKYSLEWLASFLKDIHTDREEEAEIVVSTLHKAKGREWDQVVLWDDFVRVWDPVTRELYRQHGLLEELVEEENILYVALTRPRRLLSLPKLPDLFAILTSSTPTRDPVSAPVFQNLTANPRLLEAVEARVFSRLATHLPPLLGEAIRRATEEILRGPVREAIREVVKAVLEEMAAEIGKGGQPSVLQRTLPELEEE